MSTEKEKKSYYSVRLGVDVELEEALEKDRIETPKHLRLTKSAHIRQILWEHVLKKERS